MVTDFVQGTQAYVAYNVLENEIIVSFRGSTNIANWVSNLNYFQTPYKQVPGAQVHRGFFAAYNGVQGQVINAVRALFKSYPSARILFTGHSLGGALASIAAVDLKEQLGLSSSIITFYTYGSPRVGNQAFSDYVFGLFPNGGYQRVTHYNDVVPHVPPTAFGFNHIGDETWYFNAGTDLSYRVCKNQAGKPESSACSNSIVPDGIAAHLVYVGHQINGLCTKRSADEFTFLE